MATPEIAVGTYHAVTLWMMFEGLSLREKKRKEKLIAWQGFYGKGVKGGRGVITTTR